MVDFINIGTKVSMSSTPQREAKKWFQDALRNIAKALNLENPDSYSHQSFRRGHATELHGNGASKLTMEIWWWEKRSLR